MHRNFPLKGFFKNNQENQPKIMRTTTVLKRRTKNVNAKILEFREFFQKIQKFDFLGKGKVGPHKDRLGRKIEIFRHEES